MHWAVEIKATSTAARKAVNTLDILDTLILLANGGCEEKDCGVNVKDVDGGG